jgi:hypothetical protein
LPPFARITSATARAKFGRKNERLPARQMHFDGDKAICKVDVSIPGV